MSTTVMQPAALPRRRRKLGRYVPLAVMMLPGLLYLVINNYLPMFGLFIAFKDVDFSVGVFRSNWVGLQNFKYLFMTSDAWTITRNTLGYNALFIMVNLVVALTLAIALNEVRSRGMRRLYQSLVLLPMLVSMVIVSYLVYALLSVETGFVNKTVLPLLRRPEVSWYSEPRHWPWILTFVNVWKGAGFLSVVYYAAIVGIDQELYEAATIDGASRGQQVTTITLPLIVPVITMMTLMAIGRIFYSDFGLFYQVPLASGPLMRATSVIDTYVYQGLIVLGDVGMSSAAGFYQSIVGFTLVLVSNALVRRMSPDNALF